MVLINIYILTVFLELLCYVSGHEAKVSLTFVIDDTSSMQREIKQVKSRTKDVFEAVLNSNISQIEEFVIVTFNDPEYGDPAKLKIKTNDSEIFAQVLDNIIVGGGHDCPEMAMSGIELALEESKPNSFLYVFTDASAKDYSKYDNVKSLAQDKSIQITFLLTGECVDDKREEREVYDQIAADTSGQVFHIEKQEISKIINYILVNLKSKRTVLLRKTFQNDAECKKKKFTVDSKLWDVLISISAPWKIYDALRVIGPSGKEVELQNLIQSDKTSIVTLQAEKGEYIVYVEYCKNVTIVVTASTSISFQYGFSSAEPISFNDVFSKPIPDKESYLAIELNNKERDVTLANVEIMDMDDNYLKGLTLRLKHKEQQFYVTEKFTPPEGKFKIVVNGHTDSMEKITRVSPTTVEYYNPLVTSKKIPPTVSILGAKEVYADYDKPLELKCKVHGIPKPEITWETAFFFVLNSTLDEIAPHVYISTLHENNVKTSEIYTCRAVNFEERFDNVKVTLKNKFSVVTRPKDAAVEYGASAIFYCKIDAIPPATITWYRDDKEIENDDDAEVSYSPDSSTLKIKNAQPRLNGKYFVIATNGAKTEKYAFDVTVITATPRIDKSILSYTRDRDSSVDILCRVIQGTPTPDISWSFDQNSSWNFKSSSIIGETFHIDHVRLEHVGIYKCKATNVIGTDYHSMALFIQYPITVEIIPSDEIYEKGTGDQVILQCSVDGLPTPHVRWLKEDLEIVYGAKYKIYRDHTLSFTGATEDTGNYTCEAWNHLNVTSKSVFVRIYDRVLIEIPKVSSYNVTLRDTLSLECRVKGDPRPTVKWLYHSKTLGIMPKPIKCDENNSIKIAHIQLSDEGYYECTADNKLHSETIVYTVNVPAPAHIIRTHKSNNIIKVVEGDWLFHMECDSSGSPKPTVTWMVNGKNITGGGQYEISDKSTLIVYDVTSNLNGTYTCIAHNHHSRDTMEYEVEVHSWPPIQENPSDATLLPEGELNYQMKCAPLNLYLGNVYSIRWFKDGNHIKTGNLILNNVTRSDAGHYSCRVNSNILDSAQTYHRNVIVGTEPKFLSETNCTVTFVEGAESGLDCSATGYPPPTTKWWSDNVHLPEISTSQYSFIMKTTDILRNVIMCTVSNKFGTIKRYFQIVAGDCLMKLDDDFTARQPILVNGIYKRKWPTYPTSGGSLRIQKFSNFTLYCPESFITYQGLDYGNRITSSCVGDSMFELNGLPVNASDITCKEQVIPLAQDLYNDTCLGKNTGRLNIGFDVDRSFMSVFMVCFDYTYKMPRFVVYGMSKTFADTIPKYVDKYTKGRYLSLRFDEIYDCKNQVEAIASFTGKRLKFYEKCCFGRRQLVNPKDVLPGISQVATYHYMNVVPQWNSCGTENWDEVERRLRSYVLNLNKTLSIWTGAQSVRNDVSTIYLTDTQNERLEVPQYIWKVVQGLVVIIHINVPGLTSLLEASSYVLCNDICDSINWMKNGPWHDLDRGYIYCCSIADFENAFDYYGENLFA